MPARRPVLRPVLLGNSYYHPGRDGSPHRRRAEILARAQDVTLDADMRRIEAKNAIYHAERSWDTGRLTAAGRRTVAAAERILRELPADDE